MDIKDLEQAIQNGGIPAWATEETLAKVAKALNVKDGIGNLNKTIGKTGDTNPKTFIGGLNAASASTQKLSKSTDIASKAPASNQWPLVPQASWAHWLKAKDHSQTSTPS